MMEPDSKRIVREWNREIEEENRRRDARRDNGPWKIIVWVALEVLWFVAIFAVLTFLTVLVIAPFAEALSSQMLS